MLIAIFITLVGMAVLLPGVALAFALRRWFVPAWAAARAEALGDDEPTHFRTRFVLSSVE